MDKRRADRLMAYRQPSYRGESELYAWYRWDHPDLLDSNWTADLPPEVWDRLPPWPHGDDTDWWKYYTSREAAMDALLEAVRSLL
jgi:hypothetical protein